MPAAPAPAVLRMAADAGDDTSPREVACQILQAKAAAMAAWQDEQQRNRGGGEDAAPSAEAMLSDRLKFLRQAGITLKPKVVQRETQNFQPGEILAAFKLQVHLRLELGRTMVRHRPPICGCRCDAAAATPFA